MSIIRESAVTGIKTCLEIAKVCKDKDEIVKELTKFLKEQEAKL